MLLRYIKIYLAFFNQIIKSALQYKADYAIGICSTFIMEISKFLFIWVVFKNINNIHGWSFYEIAFVFGVFTLSKAFFEFLFHNVWDLEYFVRVGAFDTMLIKPVNTLFYFCSFKINIGAIGELVVGFAIVFKSLFEIKQHVNIIDISVLLLFVISGAFIFFAIIMIPSTICFRFIASREFVRSVQEVGSFAQFPLNFYNKFIKIFISIVLPYSFASFYPASYFLDKGFFNASLLTPVVAILLWAIMLKIWNYSIRNYSSTGS